MMFSGKYWLEPRSSNQRDTHVATISHEQARSPERVSLRGQVSGVFLLSRPVEERAGWREAVVLVCGLAAIGGLGWVLYGVGLP